MEIDIIYNMNITIKPFLYQLSNKGYMAWEYNPFHNFRITDTKPVTQINSEESSNVEAGSIVDLDTPLLNFDLEHPVTMDIQPSYDGTVNVIFNDNKNVPRLINSRFSTTELNTYELVDRVGDNDTNIYDQDSFDLDSSLYKRINSIPTVKFIGVNSSGQLKVGNYNFYFKYSDADGNETDFVADSGVVAIFKGNDCDPFSIDGGISDENAFKAVSFQLNNIDYSYNYITVYYTRNTGDSYQTRSTKAYKINDKYIVKHQICTINVTGLEDSTEIPISEINNQFFQVNKAKTSAQCQNRLFLGNVAKPDTPYKDMTDISLRMLPILNSVDSKNTIGQVEYNYVDDSSLINSYEYYNTKNIYYNVGYWTMKYIDSEQYI